MCEQLTQKTAVLHNKAKQKRNCTDCKSNLGNTTHSQIENYSEVFMWANSTASCDYKRVVDLVNQNKPFLLYKLQCRARLQLQAANISVLWQNASLSGFTVCLMSFGPTPKCTLNCILIHTNNKHICNLQNNKLCTAANSYF